MVSNTRHRTAVIVLAVGAVTALAASLGPASLARIGVLIAVAAGVVAIILVARAAAAERRQARIAHGRDLVAAGRREAELLSAERRRNRLVLEAVEAGYQRQLDDLRDLVSARERELGSARAGQEHLVAAAAADRATIEDLRATLAAREALAFEDDDAEVFVLPRRGLSAAPERLRQA